VAAKGGKVDRFPGSCVGPFVFFLEVPLHVSAIDLEPEIVVDVASVLADVVDGDGDFGGCDVVRGRRRLRSYLTVECSREAISINVEFRVRLQFFVFGGVVLVAFNPLCSERPSEFVVKVADH
jgi:hypothetical protein